MSSKIYVSFFLFISSLLPVSFSQTDVQKDSSIESYNHEIQFYIVNEIIAAYKYKFDDNSSLRLTFNATGLVDERELDEKTYYNIENDSLLGKVNESDIYSNHYFELKVQYLHSINFKKIVSLYFGAGTFITYNFVQNEFSSEVWESGNPQSRTSSGKNNSNIWQIGLSAVLGLELTVYENINVFAEYEAVFQKGWRTVDEYSNGRTYVKNNDYELNGYRLNGIRIGFGICF